MPGKRPHAFHTRKAVLKIEGDSKLKELVIRENDSQYSYFHESSSQDHQIIDSVQGKINACPYCKSESIIKWGRKDNFIRYKCKKCHKTFSSSTSTLLDRHKLPIKTMLRFYINVITGSSINEASKVAKISLNTGVYWMKKAFYALKNYQVSILLSGNTYIDEKYISVDKSKLVLDDKGRKLRGLSRNKWCIAIGTDRVNTIVKLEGKGKISSDRIMDAFAKNIKHGSTLIHDMDHSHDKLITHLLLIDEGHKAIYKYKQIEELEPINKYCSAFAYFFRLHRGLEKEHLQGWLDFFSFIHSNTGNANEKAMKLIELIIKSDKIIRYRD